MTPLDLDCSTAVIIFLILAGRYSGTRCRNNPMPGISGGFPVCRKEWIRLHLLIPARSLRLAWTEPRFSRRESPHRGCDLQNNGSWSKLFSRPMEYVANQNGHTYTRCESWHHSLMDFVPDLFCIFSICLPTNCRDVEHLVFYSVKIVTEWRIGSAGPVGPDYIFVWCCLAPTVRLCDFFRDKGRMFSELYQHLQ